jgi:tRNA A-37 threonylcarbamoyl transferase component Bud32
MTPDREQAGAEPNESDQQLFELLNGYWEALARGEKTDLEGWIDAHPEGKDRLGDLQLVATLHDAYAMAEEDSRVDLANTRAFPAGYRPVIHSDFLQPGLQLGHCRIERRLGHGGMGEVYLANHLILKRQVAVKEVQARLTDAPGSSERFLREAELLAKMGPHPNLASAYDAGIHNGHYYLVMEYVPGINLKTYLEQAGPLPVAQACEFMRQAALGLDHMHKKGVVHRDIKPSNLMLTEEQTIKILDLGLARLTSDRALEIDPSLTPSEALLGTFDYQAPEQARDAKAADARSDLYSLGCTFYDLLTGRPPFDHCQNFDKLVAHARDEPQAVRQLRPEAPDAIAAAGRYRSETQGRHQEPGSGRRVGLEKGQQLIGYLGFATCGGMDLVAPDVTLKPGKAVRTGRTRSPDIWSPQ